MHPLNPFLRAFFRSTLPSQCSPAAHHIILVPTTDVLLASRDRETNTSYYDLSTSEEFLASHVLRAPGGLAPQSHNKDGSNFRDNRGKAKQYSTLNGRTVIVKDAFVYSNKGFKSLNQAQLLHDVIYYPDTIDAQQWLVYYISRPLIGTYDPVIITPASITTDRTLERSGLKSEPRNPGPSASYSPRKKEVRSFSDLLNHFPMIARQMHPGLDRLFKEFNKELEKSIPFSQERSSTPKLARHNSISSAHSLPFSVHSSISGTSSHHPTSLIIDDEEDMMRKSLETAVTAAIDLFQMVDKQQLSLLGATTDLTGPIVERMIERYIVEQVHSTLLFPRICSIRRFDDLDLEARIRQMSDIDISQVGITIGNGQRGKKELAIRLSRGVDVFKKMAVAGSPQEMVEILLETQKLITAAEPVVDASTNRSVNGNTPSTSEKQEPMLTINADTLVSLLLVVVIRSPVKYLQARLSYMRHFIFIDDVESGEMGYALSTFEAVLSYLSRDSGRLRRSSRRNKRLWQAVRKGDVPGIRSMLDLDYPNFSEDADVDHFELNETEDIMSFTTDPHSFRSDDTTLNGAFGNGYEHRPSPLAHVFPFQRCPTPPVSLSRPKVKKRVSMDTGSISSSSMISFRSRTNTIESNVSGMETDTSVETLTQTQGLNGESLLMMAVESGQDNALSFLLSLDQYFSPNFVPDDCNNEGSTLFSTAVQLGHRKVVEILLDYIIDHLDSPDALRNYFAIRDSRGRCVAHYLFNQPHLIGKIGHLLPWRLRDKNGQTPLFALIRSYDHDEYKAMVESALSAALDTQGDDSALHLDDHVDGKRNTLLHAVNDPQIALRLLYHCDSDPNAANDRQFTPLMVASKYGRTDIVRVLFGDARVDLLARDLRGLTAVELAKDDEVRNRIDDLVLLSSSSGPDGRTTTVVRSFFVEDGSVRLVIKSGAPNTNSTITVTTCRRSFTDFENLARWLALEHPASWLPPVADFLSPFLIPSKPSRSVLRDMQLRLDSFLKILLSHPTFATHEMVWEFFLVPDIDPTMLAERSKMKAEARADRVKDEYTPVSDVRDVELFVAHAKESMRGVHQATKGILRRTNKVRVAASDLGDAALMACNALSTLNFIPRTYITALDRHAKIIMPSESSPIVDFYYNIHAISTCSSALLAALNRPSALIGSMSSSQKAIDRQMLSVRRNDRWPLGLMDETRHRMQREAAEKVHKAATELDNLGKELRYTQQVVAGELASWQDRRIEMGRKAVREFAKRMVVVEKAKLESLRRTLRGLHNGEDNGDVYKSTIK
ncbi:hypothetical protein M501DRAFT_998873 [Patellaria atrata CBS 101060]|uniref:VPS9 domain-containing protein n=1 Tax=Patellaria atrata CBS 101060 TaxID=1346257 RepID=A0A9P4SHD3_9PEZI|nr:hypothetical protein M501DRAFT_998873 [Patellaria atrata CBS 101060]